VARILAVDDDPSVVHLLADVLRAEGHKVTTVTQGVRVFSVAQRFRPDLILMDIMMPYLDGVDQMRLLARHETLSRVPVIVVTAKLNPLAGASGDALRALRIAGLVEKPFNIADLLGQIDAVLAEPAPG
jgi:DNA-binding response OmpR family regulator